MALELSEERIRGIVAHFARLRAEHGDAFAAPELVEPNGAYFPDEFTLDPPGIDRLLRRMLGYVPISNDVEVKLGFLEDADAGNEASAKGGSCSSGGCGTGGRGDPSGPKTSGAIETEDGYAVLLHVDDVGERTVLTTAMARSAGRLVLFEADEEVDPRDEGPLSELTAIASGLGVLVLNGACVYKKGCGGMRRHQATFLELEEIALGLALFVRTAGAKPGTVRRYLEITQREAFDDALGWVDGQPTLIQNLVAQPETLTDGIFELEAKRGLLSRLFSGRSRRDALTPASVPTRARARSEEEERRLAEARALVDEALG